MPVVNREVERAIVERARARGMADEQIKQAVLKYRAEQPQFNSIAQPSAAQQPTAAPVEKNNLLTAIAKPFIKTAAAIPAVIGGVSKLAQGDVQGAQEAITKERSFGALGSTRPIGINQETGEKQKFGELAKDVVGTGAEIASYAAPTGALGKGASLGAKAMSAAKAGALGGALGGFGQGLQEKQPLLKTVGQTVTGAALGGATGGALPILGAGASKIAEGAGDLGAEILGRTTGGGEASIREVFNNPNAIKFARKAGKEGQEGLLLQAVEEARSGLDNITSSNNKEYREAMKRIKANPQDLSEAVSEIRNSIVNEAKDNFGIRFGDGKKLNNLDFNASDVVEGANSVQRAFDRFFAEPIKTIEDLDRVKKSLGRLAQGAPARSPAQALIYKMKEAVSATLKSKVPGYAEEMARFGELADLSDEITKALSLGDKASIDTTIRKLMSTMRQNNELRKAMLSTLGKSGNSDIMGKIAGATLAPKTPRGLQGVLTPSVGTGIGILHPQSIPAFLFYLASTSPRLVAEAVALLGKFKGTKIPLVIQQQLKNLLIQAEREAASSQQE